VTLRTTSSGRIAGAKKFQRQIYLQFLFKEEHEFQQPDEIATSASNPVPLSEAGDSMRSHTLCTALATRAYSMLVESCRVTPAARRSAGWCSCCFNRGCHHEVYSSLVPNAGQPSYSRQLIRRYAGPTTLEMSGPGQRPLVLHSFLPSCCA